MDIFGPPTIGPAAFDAAIPRGSPVRRERATREYYDLAVSYGVDPAFALGWGMAEHGLATDSKAVVVRYGIKNWGDCRSRRKASLGGKVVATDRGNFWAYDSWLASLDDALYRITDKAYDYQRAGVRTVEQMAPIAAPPSDFDNDPQAWANNVIAHMRRAQAMERGGTGMAIQQYAELLTLLPPGGNRPGTRLRGFHAFVWHETDNERPGTGARNTYDWLVGTFNGSVRPPASFHFVTDGIGAGNERQLLPAGPGDAEVGWHIGDGADQADDESMFTVAGEVCVNSDGDYRVAVARMARIAAKVIKAHGARVVDGATLRQHGSYWSARNPDVHRGCPRHAKAGDWGITWAQIVALVQAEYDKLGGTVVKEPITGSPSAGPHARIIAEIEGRLTLPQRGTVQGQGYVSVDGRDLAMVEFEKGRYVLNGESVEGMFVDPDNAMSFQALDKAGKVRWG